MTFISFLQRLLGPKTLEEIYSQYSGLIRVVKSDTGIYIATGALTQSGGLIKDIWQPVLKKIAHPRKSWLILGLATGTAAQLISTKHSPSSIVGIEIDPIMINLGKKYFALGKIPNLKIITGDAARLDRLISQRLNYILVDIYLGDKLPEFVYSAKFLNQLKGHLYPGGTLVINHLFYDAQKRTAAGKLVLSLQKLFPHISFMRKLTNLLIICT